MHGRFLLSPVLALMAALLLTGCTTSATPGLSDNGVSALPADEILAKARAALAEATSYHVKAEVTEAPTASTDLVIAGQNFSGRVTFVSQSIELVRVGTDLYVKAPDGFWTGPLAPTGQADAIMPLLNGKYVKLNVNSATATTLGLSAPWDPKQSLEFSVMVTKGPRTKVNGQDTVALTTDNGGTLYVATTGTPYPIRLEFPAAHTDFSDFEATVDLKAPPASDVFDLSVLLKS